MSNYTVLHCHTMLSNGVTNIDSVNSYEDYINKAIECNMTAIALSEHGNFFNWKKKKDACEKERRRQTIKSKIGIRKISAKKVLKIKTLHFFQGDNSNV